MAEDETKAETPTLLARWRELTDAQAVLVAALIAALPALLSSLLVYQASRASRADEEPPCRPIEALAQPPTHDLRTNPEHPLFSDLLPTLEMNFGKSDGTQYAQSVPLGAKFAGFGEQSVCSFSFLAKPLAVGRLSGHAFLKDKDGRLDIVLDTKEGPGGLAISVPETKIGQTIVMAFTLSTDEILTEAVLRNALKVEVLGR